MTEDILVLLLPYLSSVDSAALFEFCLSPDVIGARDNGIQKRGYKILARLTDRGKFPVNAEDVLQRLDAVSNKLTSAAKKPYWALKNRLKSQGGGLRPYCEDGEGKCRRVHYHDGWRLGWRYSHTISATITAISRLVFEFKDAISPNIHTEILSTILVFLTSANREIVKSALGYVKLAIHTLPVDLVRPHLKDLVHQLLAWSHDHKNHFKVKVRHIFERMIRRFGWDAVYACAEGEDSSKVLLNIKKRKDRAKRKRANKDQEENEPARQREDIARRPTASRRRRTYGSTIWGRVADNQLSAFPSIILLADLALAHKIKGGVSLARSLSLNTDDAGKLVIESSDDEAADNQQGEDVVGTAYHESLTSVDGFTRGPKGQVKFNKDTKKRRREADERDQDVEMADPEAAQAKPPKNKKKTDVRPGQEFKAKASVLCRFIAFSHPSVV
ncbi:NUC173-domain-containing protein [Salix suchowensis]|nr:NUC173-domain-containing protein [Salix suchowensis]